MSHPGFGRRGAVVLLTLAMVISACSTKTSSTDTAKNGGKPKAGGTLNVGLGAETDGWNPTASQWAGDAYETAQTVFDPLVVFGADQKPHPNLAQSVTPNADNTVWTIKLRSGISFHDGEPLNADAVKLQLDKDKASFLVGQAFRSMESVEKVDDLTLKVNMNQPWVAFPSAIAGQAGFIAAPKQLNDPGKGATDTPIGTGAYVFKEWVRDDHFTVTKNPKYWRKDVAYPNQITFRVIPSDQTRLASVQSGQLDIMSTIVASEVLQARRDQSLQTGETDADSVIMMMMNQAVAPIDDIRVRQALVYATDQNQLISTVGRGLGKPATSPYLPGSTWYADSGYPTKPNVGKAKSLIDEYKRDKGISGDLNFTVGCTPTPTNTQAMELIKSQWKKAGISVDLKFTEQAAYINNALNGQYTVNCWTQLGASDPDGDSIWWTSANANAVGSLALNFMRMKDPQVDDALKKGHSSPDLAARKQAYATIWKRFTAIIPYAYLGHAHSAIIWSKNKVHGIGDAKLPDGTKVLMYRGALPAFSPLSSVWISQ